MNKSEKQHTKRTNSTHRITTVKEFPVVDTVWCMHELATSCCTIAAMWKWVERKKSPEWGCETARERPFVSHFFFWMCMKHHTEYVRGRVCVCFVTASMCADFRIETERKLFNASSMSNRWFFGVPLFGYLSTWQTKCALSCLVMLDILVVCCCFRCVVIGTLLNYGVLQRIQCLKSLQLYQQIGMRIASNFERMNKCLLMLLLQLLLLLPMPLLSAVHITDQYVGNDRNGTISYSCQIASKEKKIDWIEFNWL